MFSQKSGPETVIKKYHNRRLYDPTRNCHVTLAELADRVKSGERIRIIDNQNGEDLTSSVMGQVLYETLKSRPDYLPLDLVLLMIRAQDTMVRDFLFNGLPYAFQMYLENQRRLMSGMGWMNQGFPNPLNSFSGNFPGLFGGQTPNPGVPPQNEPGTTTVDLREELERLRNEVQEMKTGAAKNQRGRKPRTEKK